MSDPDRWNTRYLAYAKTNGRTPEKQMAYDRRKWPGGHYCGYILWIADRKQEFKLLYPGAMIGKTIANHDAFTTYIQAYANKEICFMWFTSFYSNVFQTKIPTIEECQEDFKKRTPKERDKLCTEISKRCHEIRDVVETLWFMRYRNSTLGLKVSGLK